jgi:hypothetical protein
MFKHIPQWLIDWLLSKPAFWLTGLISGLSLLVEAKRRRGELAMYVLPKGLESAWVMARGKGLVFRTGKWGDVILTAMGMGMVMVRVFSPFYRFCSMAVVDLYAIVNRVRIKTTLNIYLGWFVECCISLLGLTRCAC